MAATIQDSTRDESNHGFHNAVPKKMTPIQTFYSKKNIFITGATGFLGKLLLEKLLWSCPDIGHIFLLVREKKCKNLESRLRELLESEAFARVKKDVPGFRTKIKVVAGDCALPGLGLSEEDRNTLINEIHVVFHVAATVKFAEPLPLALAINVGATKEIVEMSKQMKNLQSFIHVSTAFAKCHMLDLEERFYDGPMDPIKLLDFVETVDPGLVDDITQKLIGKWPNTYTFTKGLAEDYLRSHAVGMPLGVFRPSVVTSSLNEPLPRWVDNWYGVSGFITACGSGILRTARVCRDGVTNIIPVDMCVNGLIATGWDVANRHRKSQGVNKTSDITIYNFTQSLSNTLTWGEMYEGASRMAHLTPPSSAMWYRGLLMVPHAGLYRMAKFFLHDIPSLLVDTACLCMGKKAEFVELHKKIDTMMEMLVFFSTRSWTFTSHNMPELISRMTQEDRQLYFCDMRQLNWDEYLRPYFLGVRRYLLKEDDSTIPTARKRYYRLYILHLVFRTMMCLLVFNGLYGLVNAVNIFGRSAT